jgi:mannose-6-phosphate isomerase-like protein (cupin superfamily)
MPALDARTTYVHLGEGPEVTLLPVTDDFWSTIADRTDLEGGRLVTSFDQTEDWKVWEMHPGGDELVYVLAGSVRFHLERGDGVDSADLGPMQYVVVPAGTWHTADVNEPGQILVITWGEGTTHRPR